MNEDKTGPGLTGVTRPAHGANQADAPPSLGRQDGPVTSGEPRRWTLHVTEGVDGFRDLHPVTKCCDERPCEPHDCPRCASGSMDAVLHGGSQYVVEVVEAAAYDALKSANEKLREQLGRERSNGVPGCSHDPIHNMTGIGVNSCFDERVADCSRALRRYEKVVEAARAIVEHKDLDLYNAEESGRCNCCGDLLHNARCHGKRMFDALAALDEEKL